MRHRVWCILVVVLLLIYVPFLYATEVKCDDPLVELTVSPLVSKNELRVLEITWDVKDWRSGDWVALHVGSPNATPSYTAKTLFPAGWVSTKIMESKQFMEPNYNTRCLGFWVSYNRANSSEPLAFSCLMSNPRWMEEHRDKIGNLRINDMFLPGTHDTAAFKVSFSPYKLTRYDKYTFAQDETVLEQLIHGARILDLRIGFYNGVFWSNHGIAKIHPFEHILQDIKDFITNTDEIVVLDFHNFPVGFKNNQTHDMLVKYVKDRLGPWLAPPRLTWSTTLNRLWYQDKRVIFAYNDQGTVSRNPDVLFPAVSQKWANVLRLKSLKDYFADIMRKTKPSTAWSAMAELTPNTWTVLTDEHGGLRVMAETTNKEVTNWFRKDWGGRCNGVAVDFIRSSGIVNAAIRWNQLRADSIRSC